MSKFRYLVTKTAFGISIVVALFGLATVASAATMTLNVDFNQPGGGAGTYVGLGAYTGDTGTYWNGFAVTGDGATSGNLKASNGTTTTTANMTLNWGTCDDTTATNVSAVAPALMDDYAFLARETNAIGGTFTISGLQAGEKYQLYLYSQNGGYASAMNSIFTVGGVNATAAGGVTGSSFVLNGNYVVFSDVTADAGGTISGSGWGYYCLFDGLQIVGSVNTIPEPGTLMLLATGLLGLLAYAWRKRK